MGTYSYSGAPIKETVTTAGTYDITGYGGAGGNSRHEGGATYTGGSGAKVSGAFQLTAGEKIEIFVGGAGKAGFDGQSGGTAGGGGGGTFVLGKAVGASSYTLLLAAGGGGGASYTGNGGAAPATLSTSGGAGGASGPSGGGGGAGSTGNGANGSGTGGTSVTSATTPGAGGAYGNKYGRMGNGSAGGLGGGGGGGVKDGGGGGGYTGGNGAYVGSGPATGGTSFLVPTATMRTIASAATENAGNNGAGELIITPSFVCYVAGTLIRTTRGDVAVEALAVGDLVVTASGAHRPIRWLGHRAVDCRNHPRPHEALPVRIAAHALAPNRPARDLFVSPGHSICVDVVGEVLIPAFALTNGATIQQVEVDEVTYWHVELDSHDLLLAENLPAESYLDMGNRDFFAENGVVALDASPDAPVPTHADFCRPFHMDGRLVEVVRAQLSARARTLGWRLEAQGLDDLHLLVDGVRVTPQVRGFVARFAIPAEARDVWLVTPTSIPATVLDSPDLRALGACLTGLDLDDGFGGYQTIAVDDPRLCVGFHAVEGDAAATWRWTAGRARLPANLWADIEGAFFLRFTLAGPMLPRWIAPAAHPATVRDPPAPPRESATLDVARVDSLLTSIAVGA